MVARLDMSTGKMSKRAAGHAVKRSIDLVDDDSSRRPSAQELKAKVKPFSPAEFKKNALGVASPANGARTNGVKNLDQNKFDQSRAVVITGTDLVDTKMAEDEEDSGSDSDEEEGLDDEEMEDQPVEQSTAIVRLDNPVNVESSFPQNALVATSKAVSVPATSLTTVLSQALRASDNVLLENCFNTPDEATISATIQRLDSSLAATLLQKLAERLHRRPGRSGNLMRWVQLTLVAHGGYLASRKDIVQDLSSLHKVITERTNSLQPLLALKGRLDMIDAQMRMREQLQKQQLAIQSADDTANIYVEDEEEEEEEEEDSEESDSDEEPVPAGLPSDDINLLENMSDSDSDVEGMPNGVALSDDMPTTKAIASDEDDEDDEGNELIDDIASETDRDTGDDSNSDSDPDAEDSEDAGSLNDFVVDDEEELPKPKKRKR